MKQNFDSINEILEELKELLRPIQIEKQLDASSSQFPLGFIVGSPRSGTTLFLQWLSSLGCFSYPTNTLARFSYAPYIGALVQKMLFEKKYDPLNELDFNSIESTFTSNLGKSNGFLEPNEFQHFFRNYINNFFPQYIEPSEVNNIDFNGLFKGLESIQSVFNKPFVTKALMIQYNLEEFYSYNTNSIFFYVKRDPIYVMQSIYKARIKYFEDVNSWWSVRPKEYPELLKMDNYHQIAGQVYFTDMHLKKQLVNIPEKSKIIINYEGFCSNPNFYLEKIEQKYQENNCVLEFEKNTRYNFKNSNFDTLSKEELLKLTSAYEYFEKHH